MGCIEHLKIIWVHGFMDTVYIERYNLTSRLDISRLVRKSLCFSKCKQMLDNHLDVYQCYINFIRPHSTLTIKTEKGEKDIERTPCMVEGITDHIWTWEEFLMFKGGVNLCLGHYQKTYKGLSRKRAR